MPIRPLINPDGTPFDPADLERLRDLLDALPGDERIAFRNDNAQAIAQHASERLLIVSGPGTGKSHLFKQRINHWLTQNPEARILALSFVRKLVADLANDITNDQSLSDEQKARTEVHTLHKYARSIVERNRGTPELRFERHLKIISELWKEVVWEDVMGFADTFEWNEFSWKRFERQMHDSEFDNSEMWRGVRQSYFTLSQFYNAAGFADLILHAREALAENPDLAPHEFCIVDEFQDFNTAEEELIRELTKRCQGLLVVGDDDQVLYETLKSGKADLIRGLYADADFANAMLPFCGRSSFHITKAAAHFIQQEVDENCIQKIYLPISTDQECELIQVIGCAVPTSAVDYIRKFTEDHQAEIDARRNDLTNKDPFLLILTPAKALRFYRNGNADTELLELVAEFKTEEGQTFPEDYYKLLSYYSCASHPEDNFTFRKILYYEDIPSTEVVVLIRECLETGKRLYQSSHNLIDSILEKCQNVKAILDSDDSIDDKINNLLLAGVSLSNRDGLKAELTRQGIGEKQAQEVEHQEEEQAELDELEVKELSAVELMTIVGSKGLSADHVIIIGFDNVYMDRITRNAFYVAMTRARKTLHLITSLRSGAQGPSRHLDNLPHHRIEFSKYVKGTREKVGFADRRAFERYLTYLQKH